MKVMSRCKHPNHSDLLLEIPVNLHQTKERFCMCCGRRSPNGFRPYDEYDMLSIQLHISYSTIATIDTIRKQRFPKSESLQEFIYIQMEVKHQMPAQYTNGYSPITVSCNICKSIWRFHYCEQSDRVHVKHCIFCGSTSIKVHAQDLDLDYWEILGNSYGMSPSLIQIFFKAFETQQDITHFNDFMLTLKSQLSNHHEVEVENAIYTQPKGR